MRCGCEENAMTLENIGMPEVSKQKKEKNEISKCHCNKSKKEKRWAVKIRIKKYD